MNLITPKRTNLKTIQNKKNKTLKKRYIVWLP